MTLTFIEIENFMEYREDYFASDDAFSALQQALCINPKSGSVMRSCGGLRKMRWPDERRGKENAVVCVSSTFLFQRLKEIEVAVFIDVYDKDETENYTSEERQVLSELAKASRDELIALSVQQRKRL